MWILWYWHWKYMQHIHATLVQSITHPSSSNVSTKHKPLWSLVDSSNRSACVYTGGSMTRLITLIKFTSMKTYAGKFSTIFGFNENRTSRFSHVTNCIHSHIPSSISISHMSPLRDHYAFSLLCNKHKMGCLNSNTVTKNR